MTISMIVDVDALDLEKSPLRPDEIVSGSPMVRKRTLWTSPDGKDQRGIWEITPGVVRDVEVSEMFVVLSGHATVSLEHGETLELGPGTIGMFAAGESTVWRVTDTLRKVYQCRKG